MTKEKQIATQAILKAGQILLKHFNKISRSQVRVKSKHEVVTPADLASEEIILKAVKKNFPSHKILSEEGGFKGAKKSEYLWVIDPLDGTTNFAMGNPLFSVSLGLFLGSEIILGVIYLPYLKELYLTEKGKGAWLYIPSRSEPSPDLVRGKKLKVSNIRKIKKSLLTYCHGYKDQDVRKGIKLYQKLKIIAQDARQIGSAAIELTWVAWGRTEAIIIPGANSWDVAAGVLLVREAQGKVTDFKGENWHLGSKDMLASNGRIHKKILEIVTR